MTFKDAVNDQFNRMISLETELFYINVERDELFELYLNSFPEGTNPMYRERTIHDCNSCKKFIRDAGHIVAIVDNQIVSIWDVLIGGFEQVVANALSEKVKSRNIVGVYRHREKTLGSKSHQETLESGRIKTYDHFHYVLPPRFVSDNIATERSNLLANKEVLERSLKEISLEAGEVVLELIEENQLYRGQEFITHVQKFVEVKTEYDRISKIVRNQFLWMKSVELKALGRFKNTVIGTLLHDISSGTPIEVAVKKYESKVAPTNYKRPTALVSQRMIDRAEEKLTDLGAGKSVARRFAVAKDLTVNNVLFADKPIKKKMKKAKKKGVFAILEPTKFEVDSDKMQSMLIDEFVSTILPHAESIEVMVENKHTNNLMSLISPFYAKSPRLFKWHNPFCWSYNGEVTDSIRERVKKAGGNVEAFLRFSLSWDYYDDLDIHVKEPNGNEIYYGATRSNYSSGFLDVDMNIHPNHSLEPVENIAWADGSHIQEGRYSVFVENYTKRNMSASGFEVQMEIDGQTSLFSYGKSLRNKEQVQVIEFNYSHTKGIDIIETLPSSTASKEVWGIETQKWTKVNMMMLSPNFWNGEKTGNKHWFFILDNCLNPDKARGFYNEFLMSELTEHRKVFEVLSSKMKTPHSDKQLSGVGFSSTQENHILCKVSGKFDRIIKVIFAPNQSERFVDVFTEPEFVGICEVCKRDVFDGESRLTCPECDSVFHTSHFLEWVRVGNPCPVCKQSISQPQIDKIIQLITV